jgi:Tfp pilus assembly protein PilX
MNNMKHKQQGMVVLSIAMIIIFIMGAYLLFFELRTLNDLRISGNNYRSEQALQAADAGLNYGVAYVINNPVGATAPSTSDIMLIEVNTLLGNENGQVTL